MRHQRWPARASRAGEHPGATAAHADQPSLLVTDPFALAVMAAAERLDDLFEPGLLVAIPNAVADAAARHVRRLGGQPVKPWCRAHRARVRRTTVTRGAVPADDRVRALLGVDLSGERLVLSGAQSGAELGVWRFPRAGRTPGCHGGWTCDFGRGLARAA